MKSIARQRYARKITNAIDRIPMQESHVLPKEPRLLKSLIAKSPEYSGYKTPGMLAVAQAGHLGDDLDAPWRVDITVLTDKPDSWISYQHKVFGEEIEPRFEGRISELEDAQLSRVATNLAKIARQLEAM